MMHSFLLIGQSNMAGRGFKDEVEPIPKKGIYVLRNGRWWPMFVPVNPDRVTAGINLAESFAYQYLQEHPGVSVGLIPCADGGTRLEQWTPGDLLYDHAVVMAKLAQRTSEFSGILWHQGESDAIEGRHLTYRRRCMDMMDALRQDLGTPDVPILLGGLGDFLKAERPDYVCVNAALQSMAAEGHKMGFVSAEGLGANPDNLHFSATSLREFGLRYYEVFKKLDDREWTTPTESIDYDAGITDIERL